MQQNAAAAIEEGERDEVNPWLERAQWQPYLMGIDRDDLLQSIREPSIDADEGEAEPVERAVWQAMDDVARIAQASVGKSGVSVRMQAVRTEKQQTKYHPLQAYADADSIKDRAMPWKQMLMFFARTQRQHDWQSPRYKFTGRQFRAFVRLIEEAERESDDESEDEGVEQGESEDEGVGQGECSQDEDSQGKQSTKQPAPLTRIQKACLEFCIELLNQTIADHEYDCALVCGSAILGVSPGDGWKGPDSYPPILSAIIKVAHFMVVQKAAELASPLGDEGKLSGCSSPCDFDSAYESDSSSGGQRSGRSRLQWVNKMTDDFMIRGTDSPMQWFLDLRTYGLKIHYNTTASGHVGWKDKHVLEYKSVRFSMADFRGMVHGLVCSTRQRLEDLMFVKGREDIPAVPWQSLHDDPTNGRTGWSFLQDQRTQFPVDGERWLFDRIDGEPAVRSRFLRPGTALGISKERMADWMDQVATFREKLLVLMHMTGGQPARAPEILSIRHSNTVKGAHRNVFIEDGMVCFVTRYHKGYTISGDVKIIHRYLPREVGELVVWYLWLVLPFQQRMEAAVWDKQAVSAHMWPADARGKKWTSERMREVMKRETAVGLGQAITGGGV